MSGPAFGESILWRAFELSPTAFCCYAATLTRLLQRNIAGVLLGKDTMCAENCKLLGGDMFFVVLANNLRYMRVPTEVTCQSDPEINFKSAEPRW
jgi:hypothetical protein